MDDTTITYPYFKDGKHLRWDRWTGSRVDAFNAGWGALEGSEPLEAHSLSADGQFRWVFYNEDTKDSWIVSTDEIVKFGAAIQDNIQKRHCSWWRLFDAWWLEAEAERF